jgi:hypothetical protein
MSDLDPAHLDAKLAHERDRLANTLRAIAATIGALPLERAADVLPHLAGAVIDLDRRVRRVGLPASYPSSDPLDGASASGPIDLTLIVR